MLRFCIGRNLLFSCFGATLIFQEMHVDALLTSGKTSEKKYIQQSDVIYNAVQKWQTDIAVVTPLNENWN